MKPRLGERAKHYEDLLRSMFEPGVPSRRLDGQESHELADILETMRQYVCLAYAEGFEDAATHYEAAATTWATLQALAALPGRRPGLRANLVVSGVGIIGGVALSAIAHRSSDRSMPAAALGAVGRMTAFSALAGGASPAPTAAIQSAKRSRGHQLRIGCERARGGTRGHSTE